jgi:hypothetical protein
MDGWMTQSKVSEFTYIHTYTHIYHVGALPLITAVRNKGPGQACLNACRLSP